jgi:hypothetical protein
MQTIIFRVENEFLIYNDEVAGVVSYCIIKLIIGMIYEREIVNTGLAYRHLMKKMPIC